MNLEKFRQNVEAQDAAMAPVPPEECTECPNIEDRHRSLTGKLVMTCLLEESDSRMGGPRDYLAKKGATAKWVRHALFTSKDKLVDDPGTDMGALKLRKAAEAANDTCPIMGRLENWLPGAPDEAIADLTAPPPILTYPQLRIEIGLDKPSKY